MKSGKLFRFNNILTKSCKIVQAKQFQEILKAFFKWVEACSHGTNILGIR